MGPSPGRIGVALLAALLVGAIATAAQSSATLIGLVSNQTGAPVAGVEVELIRNRVVSRSATTDREGRYRFEALQPGEYLVRAAASGFQTLERDVIVAAASPTEMDLELAVQALQESLTVQAEIAEVEAQRDATPGGVTIVDTRDLALRHTNGLADMLRYVPGVWAESACGSEELFFSSRGSNLDAVHYDKNGVKLLQDGLPVSTADGNNHNRVVDPLSARYASVARGANGLTYGASTLGGAIDFVSPTARNSAPLSMLVNGGSHGSLDARATVGQTDGEWDGLVTGETKQWDGFRAHSDQQRWGMYANGGWQPSDSVSTRVFATYVNNDQRLPGALTRAEAEADPDQAAEAAISGDYGKVVKTGRLATKTNWTLGANSSLMGGLSYEEQSLFHPIVDRIFVDFDGPGPNPPVEVFSLLVDTDHRDLGAVVRYEQSTDSHDLLAGINYGNGSVEGGNFRNNGGRPNGNSEFVDNSADNVEAFFVDRWRASGSFTIVLGAQYVSAYRDVRTTNATTGALSNPEDRYDSFNPRLGLLAALGRGEVYGNVSRLFEAPTTFQMEDDVRGGNATLDAMKGTVAEIGWRSRSSGGARLVWDISAYYARIDDEILSVDDPNAPGNSLTTNVDETIHAGLEASVSASLSVGRDHRVEPRLSLSLNEFSFDGDPVWGDNELPGAPGYVLRGEVLFRHAGGWFVGPTFDLVDRRFADFANTYAVDSHELLGLRTGFSGQRWEVFGEARNLFDEEYVAALNILDVAGADARVLYPGEPLSAYVGLRMSF